MWDKSAEIPGQFHRADFDYDDSNDRYSCPNGKELLRARRNYKVPPPSVRIVVAFFEIIRGGAGIMRWESIQRKDGQLF